MFSVSSRDFRLMSKCLAVMNTSDQNSEEEQDEISNNRVKPFQRLKSEEESESEDENEQSVVEYSSDGNMHTTHTPVIKREISR